MKIFFEDEKFDGKVILEEENKKLIEVDGHCPIEGSMPSDIKEYFSSFDISTFDMNKTYFIEVDNEIVNYL